jgi:hypothetical protein
MEREIHPFFLSVSSILFCIQQFRPGGDICPILFLLSSFFNIYSIAGIHTSQIFHLYSLSFIPTHFHFF